MLNPLSLNAFADEFAAAKNAKNRMKNEHERIIIALMFGYLSEKVFPAAVLSSTGVFRGDWFYIFIKF